MTGEVFNSLWITAFGWGLTENSGAREWTEFVSSPKSNDAALRATLKDFSERFTAAKSEGRSNYRDLIPTLEEFRRRYFALLPKLRIEWAEKKTRADGGVCRICGGEGIVWGLPPQPGHRGEAPEHVREIFQNLVNAGLFDRDKMFTSTKYPPKGRFIAVRAAIDNKTFSEPQNMYEEDPELADRIYNVVLEFSQPVLRKKKPVFGRGKRPEEEKK